MRTRRWKTCVALPACALIAASIAAGCGGSGSAKTHSNSNGGTPGADAGGAGGTSTAGSGGTANTGGTSSDAGPCSGTDTQCGKSCVDTQIDNSNCGKCGTACNGGSSCNKGQCACSSGMLCGSGASATCVDTQTNNDNCGKCGTVCASGAICQKGSCTCTGADTRCGGTCVDTESDVNNCGKCGNACTGGKVCSKGTCAGKCAPGTTNCSGSCVDLSADNNNCGKCGSVCSGGRACQNSACTCPSGSADCGGSCVDEQTDNSHCGSCTMACSGGTACTKGACSKAAVCGDGTVDTGESCDDHNASNLDGCDSSCNYEVFARMDQVSLMPSKAPSYCAHSKNALGAALGSVGASNMNGSLKTDIGAGTTNIMVQLLGLDDLTGVNDSSLQLADANGKPDPKKGKWPGSSQLDWWYLLDSNTLDSNGIPKSLIQPAAINNRALAAGPSDINLTLSLAGASALLEMLHSSIHATIGTALSQPAAPPAADQLQSGLKVFETLDATQTGEGLCGDVTVESLAQIPIPQTLTTGTTACAPASECKGSHSYTYCGQGQAVNSSCNSLLDALVGGCVVAVLKQCAVTAITPTPPDVDGNGVKGLSLGANNKVQQPTQGNTNAYSAWMQFHAQRVHATGRY